MDLKNTINNTNTQKENIKQVATQIDNKLVELGGEQATDLSDVANKIGELVKQYSKIAIIKTSFNFSFPEEGNRKTIPIDLDFTPKRILAHSTDGYNGGNQNGEYADTRYPFSDQRVSNCIEYKFEDKYLTLHGCAYIESFDSKKIVMKNNRNASNTNNATAQVEFIILG